MISVGRFASGTMRLCAGQNCGIPPERPGEFEYLAINARAATIEDSQMTAVVVVITEALRGNESVCAICGAAEDSPRGVTSPCSPAMDPALD
jgi:hypothetical protein